MKPVLKNLKMFPEDFIRTSVMLVVNKCFNAMSQTELKGSLRRHAGSDEELLCTLDLIGDKVIQLPFALNDDAVNNFKQRVQRVIEMAAMEARKPYSVNMEMALSDLARMELISYIRSLLSIALEKYAAPEWQRIAEERKYSSMDISCQNVVDEMNQTFVNEINELPEVKPLEPVLMHQIQEELSTFLQDGGPFMQTFESFVQNLRLNEARESARKLMTQIVQDVWGEKQSNIEAARELF